MIDTEILKWILYGILAIYVIGLIISFFMDRISVKTGKFSESYINQGDLVYYLPTANVEVKCTAKITITKEEAGTIIIDTQLAEQSFEFTPKIVPDTNNPIALRYQPSIYANDELTLRVNELGLLESINVLAEDRLPEVANQITTAPQLILKPPPPEDTPPAATTVIKETREMNQTFLIYAAEIEKGIINRNWQIYIDGTYQVEAKEVVDASFTLHFNGMPKAIDVEAEYMGIISRPLTTLSITISPTLKTLPTENITPHYHTQIPDTSRLINVPVKRSFGIKKTYGLSFSNGKLIENTIKKSSEFESIITIPIKIAKALVSIPAELFSFKINNIKRQTSLETEKQNLSSALLTSRKNEIGLEADLLKAKLESQKTVLTYETELTKIKIDADKSLLDSQKNIVVANKELVVAKKEWENAKKELEDLLAKIEAAKKPGS